MIQFIIILIIWLIVFLLSLYLGKFNEAVFVLIGILAAITSNIVYKWYERPINFIKGEPKIINGNSGKFYLVTIKNEGKTASKNCISRIYLQGKLNGKEIIIETLLSWAPAFHKGVTDINVKDERNVDLCLNPIVDWVFNPKNSILKFADHRGYNKFVQVKQKSDGKEIGTEIDMSKVKTLSGKFIVSSENADAIEKQIVISYENHAIKVKLK